ncbi:MAG: cobalamin biosynthesis protein CbiB, partial [Pseudomonadota bacterium]
HDGLKRLSQLLFTWLDHVPARMTAFGFAVVGNFEDAVEAWRRHSDLWTNSNEGTILSAASGAVGVSLGGKAAPASLQERDVSRTLNSGDEADAAAAVGSTVGAAPQMAHLRSLVALIWRSVVLWMLLLALLSLANLIG